MGRNLPLGSRPLAGAGSRGRRCLDHARGDRHRHTGDPTRSDGHPARQAPTGQGRQGDRDPGSAERRPLDARRRPRQRPVRERAFDHREELDDRRRAGMLDEALEILAAAWSGEAVYHRGEHYTVDGMRFLPRPVQRPGVPVWVGGYPGKRKPLHVPSGFRVLPVDLEHPTSSPRSSLSSPRSARRSGGRREPFDVVAALPVGTDPAPYASAGATWWLVEFPWDGVSVDQVRGVIRDGPAPSG